MWLSATIRREVAVSSWFDSETAVSYSKPSQHNDANRGWISGTLGCPKLSKWEFSEKAISTSLKTRVRGWYQTRYWQVIKGFGKSDFCWRFSMYLDLPWFCGLGKKCQTGEAWKLKNACCKLRTSSSRQSVSNCRISSYRFLFRLPWPIFKEAGIQISWSSLRKDQSFHALNELYNKDPLPRLEGGGFGEEQ